MSQHPHSLPHEKAVLSVAMKYPDLLPEIAALDPALFAIPAHRAIHAALAEWVDTGVDLTTFVQRFHDRGLLDHVGGAAEISDIYTYAANAGHFRPHLDVLIEKRARRMAVQAGEELAAKARDESDPDGYLAAAGEPITAIHEAAAGSAPTVTTKAVVLDCISQFEERVRGKVEVIGLTTHSEIDARVKGLHPGRFWVIGGYPAGGKTLLAGQIAVGVVQQDAPALFITLEMAEREVMNRCIVQASHVPAAAFFDPKGYARENGNEGPAKGHLQAIRNAAQKLANDDLLRILRPKNRNLGTILAAIRRAHREMGIKVAVVDYLQLVRGSRRNGANKEEEVSDISHAIQEIAGELGIHVLIPSQLTKDGETKHGRVIEEDADAFLRIIQDRNRDSPTFGKHKGIQVDKDRHYGAGGTRLPLILNRDTLRFEVDTTPPEPDEPKRKGGRWK